MMLRIVVEEADEILKVMAAFKKKLGRIDQ